MRRLRSHSRRHSSPTVLESDDEILPSINKEKTDILFSDTWEYGSKCRRSTRKINYAEDDYDSLSEMKVTSVRRGSKRVSMHADDESDDYEPVSPGGQTKTPKHAGAMNQFVKPGIQMADFEAPTRSKKKKPSRKPVQKTGIRKSSRATAKRDIKYVDSSESSVDEHDSSVSDSSEEGSPSCSSPSVKRSSRRITRKQPKPIVVDEDSDSCCDSSVVSEEQKQGTNRSPGSKSSDSFDSRDEIIVERILAKRIAQGVTEYLVKIKDMSYRSADWIPASDGMLTGPRELTMVRRFEATWDPDEDEGFYDPAYCEVDRIIASSDDESASDSETPEKRASTPSDSEAPEKRASTPSDSEAPEKRTTSPCADEEEYDGCPEPGRLYYVKWKRLEYDQSTWERLTQNDADAIKSYRKRKSAANLPRYRFGKQALVGAPQVEELRFRNGRKLCDYQVKGVKWILANYVQRQGCILADEMGLGKTMQCVAAMQYLRERLEDRGPHLVIAPLSTIQQWGREVEGCTDMNCVIYHGSASSRDVIKKHELYKLDKYGKTLKSQYKFDILVTTYEIATREKSFLKSFGFHAIIVDEAHRLKNHEGKLFDVVTSLDYKVPILLTGTPIQNSTAELWTLLHLAREKEFPSLDTFLEEYGTVCDSAAVEKLQKRLKSCMLRRLKEDVIKDSIGAKEETIIWVELTPVQKKIYRCLLDRNFVNLRQGKKASNLPSLRNVFMELRKLCNHPFLCDGVEDMVTSGTISLSAVANITHQLVLASGKLIFLDKILPKLKAAGHRVLIFSQMVRCLDVLEDYLRLRGWLYERLDGGIVGRERDAAIQRFSDPESSSFVFLISTKAGGVGINLTSADTVIIFDSDWNPQNDLQAQARCHRLGQTKDVKVYRLITRRSYEQKLFEISCKKLALDQALLSGHSSSAGVKSSEIDALLKYGAYDVLKETDDDEYKQFCEEDISDILTRRTETRVVDDNPRGASAFSKATFTTSHGEPDVDLDDPAFWDKVLPEAAQRAATESLPEEILPAGTRRKRRQVNYVDKAAVDCGRQEEPLAADDDYDSSGCGSGIGSGSDEDAEPGPMKRSRGNKEKRTQENKGWTFTAQQRLRQSLNIWGLENFEEHKAAVALRQGPAKSEEEILEFVKSVVLTYRKMNMYEPANFSEKGGCCKSTPMDILLDVRLGIHIDPSEVPPASETEDRSPVGEPGSDAGTAPCESKPARLCTCPTSRLWREQLRRQVEPLLSLSSEWCGNATKRVPLIIRRMQQMELIRFAMTDNRFLSKYAAYFRHEAKKPIGTSAWWTANDDASLLQAALQFGFTNAPADLKTMMTFAGKQYVSAAELALHFVGILNDFEAAMRSVLFKVSKLSAHDVDEESDNGSDSNSNSDNDCDGAVSHEDTLFVIEYLKPTLEVSFPGRPQEWAWERVDALRDHAKKVARGQEDPGDTLCRRMLRALRHYKKVMKAQTKEGDIDETEEYTSVPDRIWPTDRELASRTRLLLQRLERDVFVSDVMDSLAPVDDEKAKAVPDSPEVEPISPLGSPEIMDVEDATNYANNATENGDQDTERTPREERLEKTADDDTLSHTTRKMEAVETIVVLDEPEQKKRSMPVNSTDETNLEPVTKKPKLKQSTLKSFFGR